MWDSSTGANLLPKSFFSICKVPQENEGMTVAVLRLMGDEALTLRRVLDDISAVCHKGNLSSSLMDFVAVVVLTIFPPCNAIAPPPARERQRQLCRVYLDGGSRRAGYPRRARSVITSTSARLSRLSAHYVIEAACCHT